MTHVFATRDIPEATSLENPSTSFMQALGADVAGGRSYTPEKAMGRVITVFACVRVLAESVGQLPWLTYMLTDIGRERAESHPLFRLLHELPNPAMTAQTFKETATAHTALWGNHYSLIDRDHAGRPKALWPMHPGTIEPVLVDAHGKLIDRSDPEALRRVAGRAFVAWFQGRPIPLLADEVFHVTGLSLDGVKGMSPIATARAAIASLDSASEFIEGFWTRGASAGGALTTDSPKPLRPEEAERIRSEWEKMHRGSRNAFRLAIMSGGLKWQNIGMPLKDAQFVEQHLQDVHEIARIFRVQPHKLGIMDRATWGNIEHEGINFLTDTLTPWLLRFEQAANRDLGTGVATLRDQGILTEFLAEAYLRTDTKGRWDAYTKAASIGAITRETIQKAENLPVLPGSDRAFKPVNLDLLDDAGNVVPRPKPAEVPASAENA